MSNKLFAFNSVDNAFGYKNNVGNISNRSSLKKSYKRKKMLPEGPVRIGGWLRLKKYNKFFSGSLLFFSVIFLRNKTIMSEKWYFKSV